MGGEDGTRISDLHERVRKEHDVAQPVEHDVAAERTNKQKKKDPLRPRGVQGWSFTKCSINGVPIKVSSFEIVGDVSDWNTCVDKCQALSGSCVQLYAPANPADHKCMCF